MAGGYGVYKGLQQQPKDMGASGLGNQLQWQQLLALLAQGQQPQQSNQGYERGMNAPGTWTDLYRLNKDEVPYRSAGDVQFGLPGYRSK